jgi:hypothetical protein
MLMEEPYDWCRPLTDEKCSPHSAPIYALASASIPSAERSDPSRRSRSDWDRATVHPRSSNYPFTKDSCTVVCQLSREYSPADGALQGAEPAHSTTEIPYTTRRDAIWNARSKSGGSRRSVPGPRREPPRPTAWSSPPAPASDSPPSRAPPTAPASATSPRPCPPEFADRLFTAREHNAPETQLRRIAAEGLAQMYFRADNTRAHGLGVEFTDVEHVDIEL